MIAHSDCDFHCIHLAMACVADVTRIAAAVSGDWRSAQNSLRLNSARSLRNAVIEILTVNPIISLLMSILTTLIGCLPSNDEIEARVVFEHPMDTSIVQLAEVIAVIESSIFKVSLALVSIEGNMPHSTIVADHPCLLEFHCSASVCFLAWVRYCGLESAGQPTDCIGSELHLGPDVPMRSLVQVHYGRGHCRKASKHSCRTKKFSLLDCWTSNFTYLPTL